MRGTVLYPLNALKEEYPDLYRKQVRKYMGREWVLETRIPPLGNCLWNDALFLTAVHPEDLCRAYQAVGFRRPQPWRFYRIEVDRLDTTRTAVLMDTEEPLVYSAFEPHRLTEYAKIPPETIAYWQEQYRMRRWPLLFLHIPHILYKGTLDVSDAFIIQA